MAFHPADYTLPAGTALSADNFEASFLRAVYVCLTSSYGGVVRIPTGRWDMTQRVLIPAMGTYCIGQGFGIEGDGGGISILDWSRSTLTGPCLEVDGTITEIPPPAGISPHSWPGVEPHWPGEATNANRFGFGGFRGFAVIGNNQVPGADAARPLTGIKLTCVNQVRFSDVVVRMCRTGLHVALLPDTNAQNCYFDNFTAANCTNGLKLIGSTQFTFTHLILNQNLGSDILLGDASAGGGASILSGMFQSANDQPAITTAASNPGGNALYLGNVYHEGAQPSFVRTTQPAVGVDSVRADACVVGGFDTVFDCVSAQLSVGQLIGNPGSKYAKLRNCPAASFDGASDPTAHPEQWDVDTYSRAGLVVNSPTMQYRGSSSDARSVTGLLAPFCAEIFDPGDSSKRSVSAGKLVSLTGLLNGTSWAAPSTPRRPVFNAASGAFRGRDTFSCTNADQSILAGTLAVPVPIGAMPGLFVVVKYTVPVSATANTSGICLATGHDNFNATQAMRIGYNDGTLGTANIYASHNTGGGGNNNTGSLVIDVSMTTRHVVLYCESTLYKPGIANYQLYDNTDGESGHSPLGYLPTSSAMANLYIGFSDTTSANYPTVEIAYVAVLNKGVPQGVVSQLMQMALERW